MCKQEIQERGKAVPGGEPGLLRLPGPDVAAQRGHLRRAHRPRHLRQDRALQARHFLITV
jgi:hypothetical protein